MLATQAKDAAADVRVRVTRSVVVHVKQTVILVLVVVTTTVQTRVRRIKVPVIQRKTPTAAQETPNIKLLIIIPNKSKGVATPLPTPLGELLEAAADARARETRSEVAHAKQTVILALVVATTTAQTRARRIKAPAICNICAAATRSSRWI